MAVAFAVVVTVAFIGLMLLLAGVMLEDVTDIGQWMMNAGLTLMAVAFFGAATATIVLVWREAL